MALSISLIVVGLLGLTLAGWLIFAPLALLPVSVGCLTAGLLVDMESLSGKSARSAKRHK